MVEIDWTDPPAKSDMKPGLYKVRIASCELSKSTKGSLMFALGLDSVEHNTELCRDWIMLEGKGRGIGIRKLRGLGFGEGDVEPGQLVGKEFWVYTFKERYTNSDGISMTSLKVDIDQNRETCGYFTSDPDNAPF